MSGAPQPTGDLLSPVLTAGWAACRVLLRPEADCGRLWLEDRGAEPPWREVLDSDRQVWRLAPGRASRCWVIAGLRRPPSLGPISRISVTLGDSARIDAAICEQAWLAVLPREAEDEIVTVVTYGPDGEVCDFDRLLDLPEYLGGSPDGGGWTAYAPIEPVSEPHQRTSRCG